MAVDDRIERILGLYPDDCQPLSLELVDSLHGFSGARLWRVDSNRGPLCLRKWPSEHPTTERLEFIQAVLWHVQQEGFRLAPLPLETRHHHGYVWHAGHLWELAPWMPGKADYDEQPNPTRLQNALATLARFHTAAVSFPLPEVGPAPSPGMLERRDRLRELLAGKALAIKAAIDDQAGASIAGRAREFVALFDKAAPTVVPLVEAAARVEALLQPCIRDIWRPHVLFTGDTVSGIIDFGAMRPENVAADVARLLGSVAGDKLEDWQRGLSAYQAVRRLSDAELTLVSAFDRSTVLMGGLQWLEWIYVSRREFAHQGTVLARLDEFVSRLATLCQSPA